LFRDTALPSAWAAFSASNDTKRFGTLAAKKSLFFPWVVYEIFGVIARLSILHISFSVTAQY
jgi:hypothetical protein